MVAYDQGDHEGAGEDFTSAILTDPTNAEAFYRMAMNCDVIGWDLRIPDWQEACRLGHSDSCYRLRLKAECREASRIRSLRKKNFEKAREYFTRGIEIDPIYADPYYNRAIAWSKTGHRVKAIEEWEPISPTPSSSMSQAGYTATPISISVSTTTGAYLLGKRCPISQIAMVIIGGCRTEKFTNFH